MSRITSKNYDFVNKYGSEKQVHKAIETDYHDVSALLNRHDDISDETFDKLYERGFKANDWTHSDMAQHPDKFKEHQIDKLLVDSKSAGEIHRGIARYSKINDTHAKYFMLSNTDGVKENLIRNPNLHPRHIETMLKENPSLIAHAVVNPKLPREHALKVLFPNNPAHENIDWQREVILQNDNLTQTDLHRIKDSYSDVTSRIHANNRINNKRFVE